MKLNRNNLLIWDGSFGAAPISVIATNDSISTAQDTASILINVLSNDSATLGILRTSVVITVNPNTAKPAVVDAVTGNIVYYPPAGFTGTQVLRYRFRDNLGNLSNEGRVTIEMTALITSWRVYEPSFKCQKDGAGMNTGNGYYEYLQKYNTATQLPVSPQELTPNVVGHPNYVAPAPALGMCPVGYGTTGNAYVINNYVNQVIIEDFSGGVIHELDPGLSYMVPLIDFKLVGGVGFTGGVSVWVYDPVMYNPLNAGTYEQFYLASDYDLNLSVPNGYTVNISSIQP